jgi:hypothetical protein
MKKALPTVALLGIDCVNVERLQLAMNICRERFDFAEVKLLTSLPALASVPKVEIAPINSSAEYSEFVIRHLAKYVDTPHVLIIQYDGFILNPDAWDDVFLDYDYIGAPWFVRNVHVEKHGFPKELLGTWGVGNGGFSMRSKKMLRVCAEMANVGHFKEFHPEDAQLCIHHRTQLEEQGVVFAPIAVAKQFSYESDGTGKGWDGEFGFHGIRWTDISKWTAQNPEYVVDMHANTFRKVL